jgi:hypothetical protein
VYNPSPTLWEEASLEAVHKFIHPEDDICPQQRIHYS